MRWRGARESATAAATLALLLLGCGETPERGPAEKPLATAPSSSRDIAFSFGGRIHLMRADGAERRRVTGGRFGRRAGGEIQPVWSPDGRRLAYVGTSGQSAGRARIYVLGFHGRQARPITASARGTQALDPAWSPDGSRIAYTRWTRENGRLESAIVVAEADGGGERVVLRERLSDGLEQLSGPAWSPDGTRILYTRTALDRRYRFRPALYAMDAGGGETRLLAPDAGDGAWSPDGTRIAVAGVRDRTGVWCGSDECTYNAELYVMDGDGTGLRRLTRTRGNESSPSWSPDGTRIVFESNRNTRDQPPAVGGEIYSIRADGSCLTWLTNGSPDSGDPSWRPGHPGRTHPRRCGATPRRPLVEVNLSALRPYGRSPAYWLGKRYRNLLLGSAEGAGSGRSLRSYFFHYDDCAGYRVRDCPRGLQLQVDSVCSGRTTADGVDQHSYRTSVQPSSRGGRLLIDIGQGDLSLITGTTQVRIFPEAGPGPARPQLLAAFRHLRRVGAPRRPLPPPALPRRLLRELNRTELVLRRTGSSERAARRLGTTAERVRQRVRLARTLDSLPEVRAISCPQR